MAELSNNTDEVLTLNKGIEHNEDWAYKHLFRECFPKIAAWQPLRGEHQELTKDLFQDALLKYRGKLAQENIENPCAWLFTVVKNDFYRHQQKNKPMITLDENKEECMDFDEQGSFSPEDWASAYDCRSDCTGGFFIQPARTSSYSKKHEYPLNNRQQEHLITQIQ